MPTTPALEPLTCPRIASVTCRGTPSFCSNGFSTQWGWFEDDDWGGALRYNNTFADTWALSANVAYENLRDERLQAGGGGLASGVVPTPLDDGSGGTTNKTTFFQRNFDEWAGSAAIKNKPTGLFAVGVFSTSATDDTNAIGFYTGTRAPDMSAWDVQGGIQRKMPLIGLASFGETCSGAASAMSMTVSLKAATAETRAIPAFQERPPVPAPPAAISAAFLPTAF